VICVNVFDAVERVRLAEDLELVRARLGERRRSAWSLTVLTVQVPAIEACGAFESLAAKRAQK
jgi:hypothetical protein